MIALSVIGGCSAVPASGLPSISLRETGLKEKLYIDDSFFPKNVKIVALGDSLTEGVGDSRNKGGYLSLLKEKLLMNKGVKSVALENFGKRGLKINQLDEVVHEHKQSLKNADCIFITIGGNDMMKIVRSHFFDLSLPLFEMEQKKFAVKLDRLMKLIRSINKDATVVLIGLYNPFSGSLQTIPEIDEVIRLWNNGSRKVMARYEKTIFVEVDDLFLKREDVLYSDQFHPNDLGYKLIAERVYERLEAEKTIAGSMEK